jgi:hypothetical protein
MQVMGVPFSASSQTDRGAGAESRKDADTGMVEQVSRLSRDAKKPDFCRLFGESFLAKNLFGGFSENSRLFLAFWRIEMMSNTMKAHPTKP